MKTARCGFTAAEIASEGFGIIRADRRVLPRVVRAAGSDADGFQCLDPFNDLAELGLDRANVSGISGDAFGGFRMIVLEKSFYVHFQPLMLRSSAVWAAIFSASVVESARVGHCPSDIRR